MTTHDKFNAILDECIEILCDNHHGIYIPSIMAERLLDAGWQGISVDDVKDCSDPDNEWYWDAWVTILSNAFYIDSNGNRWTLHHDMDLFAIRWDIPESWFED